jgi:Cd2+/Zn2+-exporting ATPase
MACDCHSHQHAPEKKQGSEAARLAVCALSLVAGLLAEHYQQPYFQTFYLVGLYAGGLLGLLRRIWGARPSIHSLMGVAVLAAVALGQWAEAVFLLLLFAAANELERRAALRSERALQALLEGRPVRARLVQGESCREVPVDDVKIGQWIEVHAGELVSLDGIVRQGTALVDCSTLTGESRPRLLEPGTNLLAGSKLLEGSLRLECLGAAEDSTLARAGELIRQARQQKLRLQTQLEGWMGVYSACLPLLALVYGLGAWLTGQLGAAQALYRSLTLLVVGSPCALVLAAPAVFLTGLVRAARSGILIKGSRHLEQLACLRELALDKTGTLTTGHFQLVDMVVPPGYNPDEWLAGAASLEARCQHPLGRSLVAAARRKALILQPVEDFWSLQGRGLQGRIGGVRWWIGRQAYLREFSLEVPAELQEAGLSWQAQGETVVWAACQAEKDTVRIGCFRLSDEVRPEAARALRAVESLGIRPFLLTGDNRGVASRVAGQLGLSNFRADLLPEDKVEAIRKADPYIAMVGDGVNDAPALATASVGIAMGASGSELAIESSDVVLVHSDLERIPELIKLAHNCRRMVWQNLTLAALTVLLLAVGVFAGKIGLAAGVLGHEGSTILVVLNGLRLLQVPGKRAWSLSSDTLGVLVSVLCLIHCLGLPLLIAALPTLGWLAPDEKLHWLLTILAVPIAFLALLPGFRVHRSLWILLGGLAGVGLMLTAPLLAQGLAEEVITSVGATLLVSCHLFNRWRSRCSSPCCGESCRD